MTLGCSIAFVRVHLGQQCMDVAVHDPLVIAPDLKPLRLIRLRWDSKIKTDVPPKDWVRMVEGEVRFQRAVELAQKKGRGIVG